MPESNNYHDLLFPLDSPRLTTHRGMDPYTYAKAILEIPEPTWLINWWESLAKEPYKGLTNDGHIEPGLFHLSDDGAPVEAIRKATEVVLAGLSDGERAKLVYPLDAPQWRRWSNPEFLIQPAGVRLEELSPASRDAVMGVLRASLSPAGYSRAHGCMLTNAFLGELCDMQTLMNEWSYNFLLYGKPSSTEPWGWSLYGHHLALNCFVMGGQMVISPIFLGAEPNVIDSGPHAGLTLFDEEEKNGLALMRALPKALAERARTYKNFQDPTMPEGRWNKFDGFHLGGAFQDNRVVPYEGVCVADFDARQRDTLMSLMSNCIGHLPAGPLAAKLREVEAHLDRTWWSWIGGVGDEDPFYYRIQSPVVMYEFDHHPGIWLANQAPAKCHIHTVVRTPNGNDYGRDLLRQHYAEVHPGCSPGCG